EVFRDKLLVLGLCRPGSRLLVGVGMVGRLFEVDEGARERSEVARLEAGQVLALCRRRDGSVVLGTGDPGQLYVLEDRFAWGGVAASEGLAAGLVARGGPLRWRAATPTNTAVTVSVRSGNVADPDDTWSDWMPDESDGENAMIAAPPARYLQYR